MEMMKATKLGTVILGCAILFGGSLFGQVSAAAGQSTENEVATLKAQLAEQQKQIDALKSAIDEQRKLLEKTGVTPAKESARADTFALPRDKALGDVASTTPIIPPVATSTAVLGNAAQKTATPSNP